jgi:hypothetical protein
MNEDVTVEAVKLVASQADDYVDVVHIRCHIFLASIAVELQIIFLFRQEALNSLPIIEPCQAI